jgi:prolipoprotein diacylglyceryltransferase
MLTSKSDSTVSITLQPVLQMNQGLFQQYLDHSQLASTSFISPSVVLLVGHVSVKKNPSRPNQLYNLLMKLITLACVSPVIRGRTGTGSLTMVFISTAVDLQTQN